MISARAVLATAMVMVSLLAPTLGSAQSTPTPIQSVFVGKMICGDDVISCVFPQFLARHRYLHVLVHDVSGNDDWQVQVGSTCAGPFITIGGGIPVEADGFVEQVIDLEAAPANEIAEGCLVFRGRNGWAINLYAAYLNEDGNADAGLIYPNYTTAGDLPDLPDLDVQYIHRDPALAYDASANEPTRGQTVTFQAHLVNSGIEPARPFTYVWSMDGHDMDAETSSGQLAPGAEAVLSYSWRWQPGPHRISFRVIPDGLEVSARNDALTVRTNALTLGFWIERSAYDYFQENQWYYCARTITTCSGSTSFADWLERQLAAWNGMMQAAAYPDVSPGGIADRVRADAIHIVPDGSLPLHGGLATNDPDLSDHTVDLEWGITASGVNQAYRLHMDGGFDLDWGLLHELGHARSLTDFYRFDVTQADGGSIDVHNAAGAPVVDATDPTSPNASLPAFQTDQNGLLFYANEEGDLMSCTCTPFYGPYTAMVWNRIRERRAQCGNANPPCNIGNWFADIPADSRLRIVDRLGNPVPDGTLVRTFFDSGGGYDLHAFQQSNRRDFVTSRGMVDLGADPFRSKRSTELGAHLDLLVEILNGTDDSFCFLEPTDFTVASWTGYSDVRHPAVLTIAVGATVHNSCRPSLPPARVNAPFAVSPFRSKAILAPAVTRNGRRLQPLTIKLIGDGPAREAMRNRDIVVENRSGKVIARDTTHRDGKAVLMVPDGGASAVTDQTDDGLVIASDSGNFPPIAGPRR